jgi:hypothetical protein
VGLAGFACVALLGAGCAVALEFGWLGERWQGVRPYLLPLVLWQGNACMAAAFSHFPFESQNARRYSWVCIGVAGVQGSVLLAPVLFLSNYSAKFHMDFFGITSSIIVAILAIYLRTSRKNLIKKNF